MPRIESKGSLVALDKPERTCRRWRMQVSLGRDYVNGGYKRISRVFRGTKGEAQKALRTYIAELESGLSLDSKNACFAEYAVAWISEREMSGEYASGTIAKNRYMLKTLLPYIGGVRMGDIDAATVSSLMIALKSGGKGQKPLAGTTTHDIFVMLKHIMKHAVERDVILRNPCDKVKAPKVDTEEKEALSKTDARAMVAMLTQSETSAGAVGALLALCAGLRREEVCGLTWNDFSFEDGCIRVAKALVEGDVKPKEPKSKASRRIIPLDPETLSFLSRWQSTQLFDLLAKGIRQSGETPIVSDLSGGYMNPSNLSRWFRSFAEENDLPQCGFHKLRHTFATLMVANGVDMVTAAALMGHSDTTMLAKVYAHAVPENLSNATKAIGGVLFGEEKTTKVVPFLSISKSA